MEYKQQQSLNEAIQRVMLGEEQHNQSSVDKALFNAMKVVDPKARWKMVKTDPSRFGLDVEIASKKMAEYGDWMLMSWSDGSRMHIWYDHPNGEGSVPEKDFKRIANDMKESVCELDEAFDMKKMLKIFNKLKKNDTIKIKYDSSISRGKEFQTFVVTSPKRTVGKKGVERVIMKHVDNPTGVKYTLYNRNGSVSLAIGDMAASMTDIQESVEQLDESLVLASDNLNVVKKTAEKLAKQSPDLTYYVVKHNERYMKGMKYAYYEVYQSVDMHLVRGKVKKIAGYGAKVDMRESVELDEGSKAKFREIVSKGKKLGDWMGKSFFEYEGNLWMLYNGDATGQGPIDKAKKNLNKGLLKAIDLQ